MRPNMKKLYIKLTNCGSRGNDKYVSYKTYTYWLWRGIQTMNINPNKKIENEKMKNKRKRNTWKVARQLNN